MWLRNGSALRWISHLKNVTYLWTWSALHWISHSKKKLHVSADLKCVNLISIPKMYYMWLEVRFVRYCIPKNNMCLRSYSVLRWVSHSKYLLHVTADLKCVEREVRSGGRGSERRRKGKRREEVCPSWLSIPFTLEITRIFCSLPFQKCADNQR